MFPKIEGLVAICLQPKFPSPSPDFTICVLIRPLKIGLVVYKKILVILTFNILKINLTKLKMYDKYTYKSSVNKCIIITTIFSIY